MTRGEAICQEFCEEVLVAEKIRNDSETLFRTVEEIKCVLEIPYFTGLVERMAEVGYCCTQVQKSQALNKCYAWFEPARPDISYEGGF